MAASTCLTLPAPAKVNRFLHITGQRANGYHTLQTGFQFLTKGDVLTFTPLSTPDILIQSNALIPLADNLIYRVASYLQKTYRVPQGIKITLHKELPIGGGLGGGSSNAATTLLALNKIWDLKLSLLELRHLGLRFGADIPFFIFAQGAIGEGIGEELTPFEFDEAWLLVLLPPCTISSAIMYAHPDLTRNTQPCRIGALTRGEKNRLLTEARNDFEPLVRRLYPEVEEAMSTLSRFAKAQLSGSGSSVFACFASKTQAEQIATHLPASFKWFVTKSVNVSPLVEAAQIAGIAFENWV